MQTSRDHHRRITLENFLDKLAEEAIHRDIDLGQISMVKFLEKYLHRLGMGGYRITEGYLAYGEKQWYSLWMVSSCQKNFYL